MNAAASVSPGCRMPLSLLTFATCICISAALQLQTQLPLLLLLPLPLRCCGHFGNVAAPKRTANCALRINQNLISDVIVMHCHCHCPAVCVWVRETNAVCCTLMHSNDSDNVHDIRCGYGRRGRRGEGEVDSVTVGWTDAVITCSVCDKNANQLSSPVTSNGIMLGLTQKCH